jgi:hypothetical protein
MAYGKINTQSMNKRRYLRGRFSKRVKTVVKKARRSEDRRLTQERE